MGGLRASGTRGARVLLVLALIRVALPAPARAAPAGPTAPGTAIVNVATARAEIAVPGEANPSVRVVQSNPVVTIVGALIDLPLSLAVAPGTTVPPGTGLAYRLAYANAGTAPLTGVRLRLPLDPLLPAPDVFTGGPGGPPGPDVSAAAYDPVTHQVTWDLIPLPPGASGALDVQVTIPAATPEDATLDEQGFGDAVELGGATVASNLVQVHVLGPVLTLAKRADREAAVLGDSVGYEVTAGNASAGTDLSILSVRDVLPPGFRYVAGSTRIDGVAAADPAVAADGRTLSFSLPALAAGTQARIAYRARAGPGAERGDGTNVAQALASSPGGASLAAGPVRSAVRVTAGIFSGEAAVIGRVWVDRDGDGRVSPGEPGVPRARLLLEDGTYVHTDVVGKYHLEGVRPGLHVLRLDAGTLPAGLEPRVADHRSAFDADTRFLDLVPDDLFRASFPVRPPGGAAFAGLEVRVDASPEPTLVLVPEAFVGPAGPVPAFAQRVEELARYLRDLGLATARVQVVPEPGASAAAAAAVEAELDRLLGTGGPAAGGPGKRGGYTDEAIRAMPPTLAILSPAEGSVPHAAGEVVVRVPLPAEPHLEVNGRPVPRSQIATIQTWEAGGLAVATYLNVPFAEGRNLLRLRPRQGESIGEEAVERTVYRAGPPAFIRVEAEPTPADGVTEAIVVLKVLDLAGNPVPDATLVTVTSDEGRIAGIDADPDREGFQVRTRDGAARFRLPPSPVAVERRVGAESGLARGEGTVPFVAAAAAWVVTGLAEARFGGDAAGGISEVDGVLAGEDEDLPVDGRAALYARGAVPGDNVLTFALDSDRRTEPEVLSPEIPPDRFFPAWGDSSRQEYDARTSGKLFARWERRGSAALWGDYDSGLTATELTRYDRRLYGMKADLTFGGFAAKLFASDTPNTLVRDEMPGAGISGPYALRTRPVAVNSERVSIEVRDRFRTEIVLERTEMARYLDYEIDYLAGTILFKQPIAARDENFNPVTIVAFYESDDLGDRHRLAGGRAAYRLGDRFEAGGTYVVEGHQAGDAVLGGIDLTYRPLPGVRVRGELARSREPLGTSGNAVTLDAAWNIGGRAEVHAYFRELDPGFVNRSRSGALQEGTRKLGIDGHADLGERLRLRGAVFSQEDLRSGFRQEVAEASVEKDFGRVVATGGYRYTSQAGGAAPGVSASMLLAAARVHVTRRLDALVARDQVLGSENAFNYPTRTRAGVEYRLPDGSKAFLVQEFENGDGATGDRTLAGVETRLSEHTVMTGAYTLQDSIDGYTNRANLGLNTVLPLGKLWTASLFGEHSRTTAGDPADDFTSLGTGFEYRPEGVTFSGRYEARFGQAEDRHLLTAAGALKLGPRYTLFLREQLSITDPDAGSADADHNLLAGVAFRPVATDTFAWLARLEYRGEGGTSTIGGPEAEALAGVFALSVAPGPRWLLSTKLAGRRVAEQPDSGSLRTLTGLGQIRLGYDVGERWNVGAAARVLAQPEAEVRETGLGVEAGYLAWKDLWVVAGYNVTGFDDRAFPEADGSERGPYLALRFKFDEASLRSIAGP